MLEMGGIMMGQVVVLIIIMVGFLILICLGLSSLLGVSLLWLWVGCWCLMRLVFVRGLLLMTISIRLV